MRTAAQPMLSDGEASPELSRRGDKDGIAYTLDHNEIAPSFNDLTCRAIDMWLALFIISGISLNLLYEMLHLHAGPAKELTAFLPFLGYCGQLIVGGVWVVGWWSWRQGQWTRKMVMWLLLSSLASGVSQALDYVALNSAGVLLYTILHSSVTFFACAISVLVFRTRISPLQWVGVLGVVVGLILTTVPSPVESHGDFFTGLFCAVAGSLCTAAAYPLAELVYRSAVQPPAEEFCSFSGSFINVGIFAIWTIAYTVPRWETDVIEPIRAAKYSSVPWAATMYASHALMVGLHTLSFWKTMRRLGTVPTAISKGVQQAGTFLFAHLFFCSVDEYECMTVNNFNRTGDPDEHVDSLTLWSRFQKPVAFVVCCIGCVVYALSRQTEALLVRVGSMTTLRLSRGPSSTSLDGGEA